MQSDSMERAAEPPKPLKREHDSTDDFEHLEHELERQQQQHYKQQQQPLLDLMSAEFGMLDTVPATPPPSADSDKSARQDELEARIRQQLGDVKAATMALVDSERSSPCELDFEVRTTEQQQSAQTHCSSDNEDDDCSEPSSEIRAAPPVPAHATVAGLAPSSAQRELLDDDDDDDDDVDEDDMFAAKEQPAPTSLHSRSSHLDDLLEPDRSPELDFVRDEIIVQEARCPMPQPEPELLLWSEDQRLEPPHKPLPPEPLQQQQQLDHFLAAESGWSPAASACNSKPQLGDAAERKVYQLQPSDADEIAPKHIFRDIGIDAWFNPEKLNPKVASLIYWRDPKKSGIVFGAILGVLLSLAYFSLISVLAYISLLTLTFTVAFRIYKTVLQAIQKTNDGHPFKEILDLDLTLPTEKVHEVADIAVSNANAAVSELRRLFLVEDFVDSLKFGILLWSLTYLGAWFNGMTLVIIGVVALFTLPKVYETNKTQIDQNLALVQAKINEITAKVKAAIPIGKKAEPTKEE